LAGFFGKAREVHPVCLLRTDDVFGSGKQVILCGTLARGFLPAGQKYCRLSAGVFGLTIATALSGVATAGTCGACGDDAQIKASIKDSFQRLPYLGAPNSIQVQTFKHVVYLSGEVSTGPMSRTAAEIAHGTPSVERVVNTISVTK